MTRQILLLAFVLAPVTAGGQGFSPADAVKRMKLPAGFTATAVATEPMIRQPLSISFDCRGRLWGLQYLQYPNPAGLKPVKQDQYLRTVWDRVPEPPPRGPKGADRITICYDADENGVFRKSKDFVTGLNLGCAFCLGNGGVYVVQPPYLLFYPDKNEDDIPDGDPEVLLTGFGMEDTHSLANSLQWGPDGWLYGAAGSTSTCKIRNPAQPAAPPVEFQQGLWRYHPPTKRFELFSEGGGNTYGLDFDRHGQAIAGTNWGGFAMLHQVQGAYYVKGFAKHGPLHNPHAYGYFDHVPYTGFKGGHVTCGGIVYQGGAYPTEFDNQYIAGNLLSNAIHWHKLIPDRDTFKASHGGELLVSNDDWFRPVDLTTGPDGCVYVADWYDRRAAHLDPIDNWDKTNGRVYRISYNGTPVVKPFDLREKSSAELVELLDHVNVWWRREARRLLAERRAESAFAKLRKRIVKGSEQDALESMWALYEAGGLDDRDIVTCLNHSNEHVRSWAIRLIGDRERVDAEHLLQMQMIAYRDTSPVVRSQLLCSLRRMPAPVAGSLLGFHWASPKEAYGLRNELQSWWALEQLAASDPKQAVLQSYHLIDDKVPAPLAAVLIERLTRRLYSPDVKDGQSHIASLYGAVREHPTAEAVWRGLVAATDGGAIPKMDPKLLYLLQESASPLRHILLARTGDQKELLTFRRTARDQKAMNADRIQALDLLRQMKDRRATEIALELMSGPTPDAVIVAALSVLEADPDPENAKTILQQYSSLGTVGRKRSVTALLARRESTKALMEAVARGRVSVSDLTMDHARTAAAFNDPDINRVIEKHFGKVGPATPGEKLARIASLDTALGRTKGDVIAGKLLYTKHCATCHKLHGEGNVVGPDLTTADRKNRRLMLMNVVDPSANVRPEFVSHVAALADGRKLTGLVAAADANAVTLVDAENKRTVIPRSDIESLNPSPVSLMPEKLLDTLTDQQVADLFAYIQREEPKR